jgi:hypothetical protein
MNDTDLNQLPKDARSNLQLRKGTLNPPKRYDPGHMQRIISSSSPPQDYSFSELNPRCRYP